MYKIYLDGEILYHPMMTDDNYIITSATVDLGLNETGSATIIIPQINPKYDSINKLKSNIEIYDDDNLIFRGRVLHDERDFNNNKEIYCEGELAWLMDTAISPRTISNKTVAETFETYISIYNEQVKESKRFTVGIVDVDGIVNYTSYDFSILLDEINERLIAPYGGYIRTRYENGTHYIDYLSTYSSVCDQVIEFGSNMLDFNEYISADNVYTVIIPLGKQLQDDDGNYIGRVNIKSVNNNHEYVSNSTAESQFGNIWKIEIFDDIEDPSELKQAGQEALNKCITLATTITINAIDLKLVDVNADRIKLGDGIRVLSAPHGIDQIFQCSKISYDLLNPAANTYEFGESQVSISRKSAQLSSNIQNIEIKPRDPFTDQEIDKMRQEILNSIPNFNLLPNLYYEFTVRGASFDKNGITWTLNGDGTVTAKGTAGSTGCGASITYIGNYVLTIDPTKTYTLSGCPTGGSGSTYCLTARAFKANETPSLDGGKIIWDTGNGATVPTGYTYLFVFCWIYGSYACPSSGVTFLPMLELGETKHSYVATTTNSAVLYSNISQNASNIQSKVSTTDYNGATIASLINQSASTVIIDAPHISLSGKQINLTSNNIAISSTNFSVTKEGSMTVKVGLIANWTITANRIESDLTSNGGYRVGIQNSGSSVVPSSAVFYAGCNTAAGGSIADPSYSNFYVTQAGYLYCNNAHVSGVINVTSGSIGDFTLTTGTNKSLNNGMDSLSDTTNEGVYVGADGIALGKSNVWMKSNGAFKFGAIRSSGNSNENAWVTNALFISYGIEILSDNLGNTPYIDFHINSNSPSTSKDFTARIVNNTTDTITFYGTSHSGATPNNCTLVAGAYAQGSDRRLKRGIKQLETTKAMQFISLLKPSSYEYRNSPGVIHHGFIYDEVNTIKNDPTWCVSDYTKNLMNNGDSYGTVNYVEIIPDLVAVVQQLLKEREQ